MAQKMYFIVKDKKATFIVIVHLFLRLRKDGTC